MLRACEISVDETYLTASFFKSNTALLASFRHRVPCPLDEIELTFVTGTSKNFAGKIFLNVDRMRWLRSWQEVVTTLPATVPMENRCFLLSSAELLEELEVVADTYTTKPHLLLRWQGLQMHVWVEHCSQLGKFRNRAQWDLFYRNHSIPFFALCKLNNNDTTIQVLALQWDLRNFAIDFGIPLLHHTFPIKGEVEEQSVRLLLDRENDVVPRGAVVYALPCPADAAATEEDLILCKPQDCFYVAVTGSDNDSPMKKKAKNEV